MTCSSAAARPTSRSCSTCSAPEFARRDRHRVVDRLTAATNTCRRLATSRSWPPRSTPTNSSWSAERPSSSVGEPWPPFVTSRSVARSSSVTATGLPSRRRVGPSLEIDARRASRRASPSMSNASAARSRLTIDGRSFAVVSSTQDSRPSRRGRRGGSSILPRRCRHLGRRPRRSWSASTSRPTTSSRPASGSAIVEAMKMELGGPLADQRRVATCSSLERAGRAGTPLFRSNRSPATPPSPRGADRLRRAADAPGDRPLALAVDHLESIRAFMLGSTSGRPHPAHARHHQQRSRAGRCDRALYVPTRAGDPRCVRRSRWLSPEQADPDADSDDRRAREYFNLRTCARSTSSAKACPRVRRSLLRALAHYGIDDGSTASPSSRRRCSGSSSPSSARRAASHRDGAARRPADQPSDWPTTTTRRPARARSTG